MLDFFKRQFSLTGRISRSAYLRIFIRITYLGFGLLVLGLLGFSNGMQPAVWIAAAFLFVLWIVACLYMVRRLHDRNRSGIWALVSVLCLPLGYAGPQFALLVLPVLILNLWLFIEVLFLRGTDGPNEYGADPFAEETEHEPGQAALTP